MQKIVAGVHFFQTNIFTQHSETFRRLSSGQTPSSLFITCSDSRINPNLITQTEPGDLFISRNAGNIVPAYGAVQGGEAATIEYAVAVLGVRHIIVCGHSHCGAMKALLNLASVEKLPAVKQWLANAESARRVIAEVYTNLDDPDKKLNVMTQENVLAQLENLRTHPAVAVRLARGDLTLHGWVYKLETGQIFKYDSPQGQFVPLVSDAALKIAAEALPTASPCDHGPSAQTAPLVQHQNTSVPDPDVANRGILCGQMSVTVSVPGGVPSLSGKPGISADGAAMVSTENGDAPPPPNDDLLQRMSGSVDNGHHRSARQAQDSTDPSARFM